MAFTPAQEFTALGMAFPLAQTVANAIANASASALTGVTALTNSTGQVGNDTVALVPAATAASTDTSAASLTSTNAAITVINQDLADLTDKVNAILAALT